MDHFSILNDTLAEPYAETARSQAFAQAANPVIFTVHHTTIAIQMPTQLGCRPAMTPIAPYSVSDHCDGRLFFNPGLSKVPNWRQVLRWKFSSRPARWPKKIVLQRYLRPPIAAGAVRVTWINHATLLLETPQGNFLTDPVFSPCCGPFGRIGPKRVHPPGVPLHELPEIHFVLLSHDHYDHCDLPSLRLLAQAHDPIAITPLGNRDLLARAGLSRIGELDWWQNYSREPNLTITVTPSQHWSNRLSKPRYGRLWGGFFIEAGDYRLYFASDTGYHPSLFTGIGKKLGQPDLAMIPIGAYEPRWFMCDQHCNPAEAVQIHCDLRARTSVAMHWGTFQLTDEGRDEPPRALQAALVDAHLTPNDFRVLEPGEHMLVSK